MRQMKKRRNKYRLLPLLIKKYAKWQFGAILLLSASSACMFLNPLITVKIMDDALTNKDLESLCYLVTLSVIVYLLQYLFKYISNHLYINMGADISSFLKKTLIHKISRLKGDFYSNSRTGDLLNCVLDDTGIVKGLFSQSFFYAASDLIIYIPVSILIFKIQPLLFICVFIMQPFMAFFSQHFNREISAGSRKAKDKTLGQNSTLEEFLSNLLPICLIGGNGYYKDKIFHHVDMVNAATRSLEKIMNRRNILMNLLSVMIITISIGLGGCLVIQNRLSLGGLMVFVQYSGQLFRPIISITEFIAQYRKSALSIERIEKVLNMEEVDEEAECDTGSSNDGVSISFTRVAFRYRTEEACLDSVSMQFMPGEVTAVVGNSGAGKSTIINLLFRIWDTDKGSIAINGTDVKYFSRDHLCSLISVVSQHSILFNGTVLDNIMMGRKGEEAAVKACKAAELIDFINSLPDKFETNIGDKGVKLSGGQCQRIEIARALVKDTPAVIFDEATSAIDSVNEKKILLNIKKEYGAKTIVIITHRLASIKHADRIYVLDKGRIAGQGKHCELIADNDIYRWLYSGKADAGSIPTV